MSIQYFVKAAYAGVLAFLGPIAGALLDADATFSDLSAGVWVAAVILGLTAAVLNDMGDPHVSSSEVWRKLRMGRTETEIAVGYTVICAHRGEYCACVAL